MSQENLIILIKGTLLAGQFTTLTRFIYSTCTFLDSISVLHYNSAVDILPGFPLASED